MNTYWMQVCVDWLEQWTSPISRLLTRSCYLLALRDGFQLAMPFVIIGSICVPFLYPPVVPSHDDWAASLWHWLTVDIRHFWLAPYQVTMGLVSLLVAFGMASSLAKQYELPERLGGLTGGVSFLLLSGSLLEGRVNLNYLGGGGIFIAIISSVYAIEIIRFFYRRGWVIRVPNEVPRITTMGFQLIAPLMFILLSMTLINVMLKHYAGIYFSELVETVFKPMLIASDSLTAVLIAVVVCHLLWFIGIHGSLIVTGVMYPFWMSNTMNNQVALAAGKDIPHIFLHGFWDFYILIGGVGATLPLVFMAWRSRVPQLRTAAKVGGLPSLFNINEPILFGVPVIMNPMFLVPFFLAPVVNAILAWYLTQWGWLDRFVTILPWSLPAPLGAAWSANGSWRTALMCVFAILNAWIIYYPFFKVHERLLSNGATHH